MFNSCPSADALGSNKCRRYAACIVPMHTREMDERLEADEKQNSRDAEYAEDGDATAP
jgi:hypothetical protein